MSRMRRFRPFAVPGWNRCLDAQGTFVQRTGSSRCGRSGHPHQTADVPTAGSRQLIEQPLRFFQIGGVETLGKPAVDGRQQLTPFASPALLAPQPGEAYGGTQFIPPSALLAGNRQGGVERGFGLCRIGPRQLAHQLAAQAVQLCVRPLLPRSGRVGQCLIKNREAFVNLARLSQSLGEQAELTRMK